jgi:hypothetical protein
MYRKYLRREKSNIDDAYTTLLMHFIFSDIKSTFRPAILSISNYQYEIKTVLEFCSNMKSTIRPTGLLGSFTRMGKK